MSQAQPNPSMSPAKQALQKIRELKRQLAQARGSQQEEIAIVATALSFSSSRRFARAFLAKLDVGYRRGR